MYTSFQVYLSVFSYMYKEYDIITYMIIIVALGNPGEAYHETRHNIGWMVMEYVLQKRTIHTPVTNSAYTARMTDGVFCGEEVEVLFPLTFMNKSGSSVKRYFDARKDIHQDVPRLVVVHDDIAIPFGDIRVSVDRGAGGHNGVRSIIQSLGTKDFVRIRVGIAHVTLFGNLKQPESDKLSQYVLSRFKPSEMQKMDTIGEKVDNALELYITQGVGVAMRACN